MNINFSFIIPSISNASTLAKVLLSIDKIDSKEIIIVDDCSGEDLSELAKRFDCSISYNESRLGASYSRNLGASNARGKYLIFLDSDVIVTDNSLKYIVENSENGIDAFEGIYSNECYEKDVFSNFYNLRIRKGFLEENEITSNCITNIFAIKKSIFMQTNGFDDEISGASVEDTEFGLTLKEIGVLIFLDKRINVIHMKKHGLISLILNDIQRSWLWSKVMFRDFSLKSVLFEEGFDHASSGLIKAMLCSPLIFTFSFINIYLLFFILAVQIYFLRSYLKYFNLEKGIFFTFESYLIFVVDLLVVFITLTLSTIDNVLFKFERKKKLLQLFKEDLALKIRVPLYINFLIPYVFSKQVTNVFNFLSLYKVEKKKKNKEVSDFDSPKGIYDYVIVGAGIGGLTFAQELNDGSNRILVIEEGDLSPISQQFSYNVLQNRYRKLGLDFTISKSPMSYYVIKGFGGAASINSGVCSIPFGMKPSDVDNSIMLKADDTSLDHFIKSFFKDHDEVDVESSWRFRGNNKTGNIFNRKDFSVLSERVNYISKNKENWEVETGNLSISTKNLVLSCGVFETPNLLSRSKILPYRYGVYFHPMLKLRIRFKEESKYCFNELSSFLIRNKFFQVSMAHSDDSIKSVLSKITETRFDGQDFFVSVMVSDKVPSKVRYSEMLDENFVFHEIKNTVWENFSKGLRVMSDLLISPDIESVDLLTMKGVVSLKNLSFEAPEIKSLHPLVNTVHAMGSMYSFDEKFEFVRKLEENGLYISDASILAGAVGTNPQLSIMLAAKEKASKLKGLTH